MNVFGEMISDQQKRKAKERVITEFKRYVVIAIYLWVLFSLFEFHRLAVLREIHRVPASLYRFGFAAVNALIMAKVVLVGEALHLGEQFSEKRVIYTVILKSVLFALLAILFNVLEGVIVGLIHGQPVIESIPKMGGGGLEGMVIFGIIASVVMIPFFVFREMQRILGAETLRSMLFQEKSKLDAA